MLTPKREKELRRYPKARIRYWVYSEVCELFAEIDRLREEMVVKSSEQTTATTPQTNETKTVQALMRGYLQYRVVPERIRVIEPDGTIREVSMVGLQDDEDRIMIFLKGDR